MNILILANKMPWPPKDGGALAILNMAAGLSQDNNQVTLLAMNTSRHRIDPQLAQTQLKQQHGIRLITTEIDTRIRIKDLIINLIFSRKPYNAQRFVSPVFADALKRILQETAWEVVQLEGLYLCPYIPLIRQHTNAHIAMRAHNIEFEIWQKMSQNTRNPLKKAYFNILWQRLRRMEQYHAGHYDSLIPITENDLLAYRNLGCNIPALTIPAGLDTSPVAQHSKAENKTTVYYLGALDWLPNQEGLRWFVNQCWPMIRNKCPEAEFHVAGRNAPLRFEQEIQADGLVYHGEVDSAAAFHLQNDIMVVPLFSGSGMRVKIIEAMVHGKALVSTPLGAAGINCTADRDIFIADTAENFANAVVQLLEQDQLRYLTGQQAKRLAIETYDRMTLGNRLLRFYESHIVNKSL